MTAVSRRSKGGLRGGPCLAVALASLGVVGATRGQKKNASDFGPPTLAMLMRHLPSHPPQRHVRMPHDFAHVALNNTDGVRTEASVDGFGEISSMGHSQAILQSMHVSPDMALENDTNFRGAVGASQGLLEIFHSSSSEAAFSYDITMCQKYQNGERVGCKLSCSCEWYASCFTKFEENPLDDSLVDGASQGRTHPRRNIGVCSLSVYIIIFCSTAIWSGMMLAILCIRTYLLHLEDEALRGEIEHRFLEQFALRKINSTEVESSDTSSLSDGDASKKAFGDKRLGAAF